ncbi:MULTISPECIES: sulfite exporter TauE/SafE family protein [Deefgea]|uniref:Probable membrane transporter protein n=1 Tax=Deefgea chitinilytica TaxID=570276 RepID=A0ABS2C7K7_9NEIS|nr:MULTISPECIES: sulfite exporter TauE/SafE family protein [Deefgea]MBM5570027.1 TSUP family transporter [Deefgea chitinilytica]MBM9887256.1 sulfite exporter TauE/SafE family protein [Deefgea sp. CFH1-16]
MELYNLIAGLLVGIIIGATGMGGGSLMTPLLIWLFGVAPTTAIGTNLCFAAITKTFGSFIHIKNKTVDWMIVQRMAKGSIPSAIITLTIVYLLGFNSETSSELTKPLSIILFTTALIILLKPWLFQLGRNKRLQTPEKFKVYQPILTILMGGALGIIVSLTSIGAGTIGTVMLVYLYPLRMNGIKLVGTDIAHATPLAYVAAIGYIAMGNVDFIVLFSMLMGSVPGIIIGSKLGIKLPDSLLRYAIALTLIFISLKMFNKI